MLPANYVQAPQVTDRLNSFTSMPLVIGVPGDSKVDNLLADLSPDTPWGQRQIAVQRLGQMRSREALPGLLAALLTDPFWMVRCSIIQALEMIGDPDAIHALQESASNDGFQTVRAYAAKAIERLSQACKAA